MADIINYKDKLLRELRIWKISLIAKKIRDDFIEELAFDLSFEERIRLTEEDEVGKDVREQERARLMSQRCVYTGCKVEEKWGQRR